VRRILPFLVFLLAVSALRATPPAVPRAAKMGGPTYGFSYAASGIVSFFKVDERHSEKAIPRPGFGGMFRINFYPATSMHIQLGLEVLSQACSFNTYYFAPGYSTFYNRSFGYTHTLRTMEMYIPLMARIGLTPGEASARNVFYITGGYSPKIFLAATTNITRNSDGAGVWGGGTGLKYENYFIGEQVGNVMMVGIGLDKRLGFEEKFLSFEAIFRYNLSRFIYYGRGDTNELLIKNMCIGFYVGYRFAGGGRSGGRS
jgi:hypothetical protein